MPHEDSHVALIHEAMKRGIPLHQIEAYLDWLDNNSTESLPSPAPQPEVVVRPEVSHSLG
jgi:hypothetical protein